MSEKHFFISRCMGVQNQQERLQLITEILSASNAEDELVLLIRDNQCPAIYRCAALDAYMSAMDADPYNVLKRLTDPGYENDVSVRVLATQWAAWLDQKPVVGKQMDEVYRGAEEAPAWKIRAQRDPAAEVNWLARLG